MPDTIVLFLFIILFVVIIATLYNFGYIPDYLLGGGAAAASMIVGGSVKKPAKSLIQKAAKLQMKIAKKYPQFKYKFGEKKSFREFCLPRKYQLQKSQQFLPEYVISPTVGGRNNIKSMLVFHKIGSGKTCSSIRICEKHLEQFGDDGVPKRDRPLVLMPASLIPNFRQELRTECTSEKYFVEPADDSPNSLKESMAKSNTLIDAKYQLFSYNKFLTDYKRIKTPLLIIDEFQNINNPKGSYGKAVIDFINRNPTMAVILLSGTPIFDNATELTFAANLMRADITNKDLEADDIGRKRLTLDAIYKHFSGKVSYFAGAPAHTFPKATIEFVLCPMTTFQHKHYLAMIETELKNEKLITHEVSNSFYTVSRQRSNVVFPKNLNGDQGLEKLTPSILLNSIDIYSTKLYYLSKYIKSHKTERMFIYSQFKEYAGVALITKLLTAMGYTEYNTKSPSNKSKQFAVWSSEQSQDDKAIITEIFNRKKSPINIIIGTPAIKEGVSLKRVKSVHVFEPYWNHSYLQQVFGRALRFCSHTGLPSAERTVDIYVYCAISSKIRTRKTVLDNIDHISRDIDPRDSIDLYIMSLANKKQKTNMIFNEVLMDLAVDKKLNKYASV